MEQNHHTFRINNLEVFWKEIDRLFQNRIKEENKLFSRVESFLSKIRMVYKSDYIFVERAVKLAFVAHQLNENIKKRVRKEKDSEGKQQLYFIHVLEMAEKATEGPRNKWLDWISIVSILLHDVPEDVVLGELTTKEEWFKEIEYAFSDSGKGKLIREIIEGLTEADFPNNDNLKEKIKQSPLGKFFFIFSKRGAYKNSNKEKKNKNLMISEKENEEKNLKTLYNLELLLKSSLKTPEHLRIVLVKILDLWSNLNSPEFISKNKRLRVYIARSLAYLFGWDEIGNEIVIKGSRIVNPISGLFPNENGIIDVLPRQILDLDPKVRLVIQKYEKLGAVFLGWRFPIFIDKFIDWSNRRIPQTDILRPILFFNTDYIKEHPKENSYGEPIFLGREIWFLKLIGRISKAFFNKFKTNTKYRIYFDENYPNLKIIDFFRVEKPTFPIDLIPEMKLFHNGLSNLLEDQNNLSEDEKIRYQEIIDIHVRGLLNFLYTSNLKFSYNICPVYDKRSRRIFFISTKEKLTSISTYYNINFEPDKLIRFLLINNCSPRKVNLLIGIINFLKKRENIRDFL